MDVCACVCVCVCMCVVSFLYSSVGRVYSFLILVIVNNATMNTGAHMPFYISVFFLFPQIYPGVELLEHILYLQFRRYSFHP